MVTGKLDTGQLAAFYAFFTHPIVSMKKKRRKAKGEKKTPLALRL